MNNCIFYYALLLLITVTFTCCVKNNSNEQYNSRLFKFEVDSSGEIVDTVFRVDSKLDTGGRKMYDKRTTFYGDLNFENESFFDSSGDLILSESKISNHPGFTKYEVFKNEKGEVDSAYQIDGTDVNKVDTSLLLYDRIYKDDKIRLLMIYFDEFGDSTSMSLTHFDENERKLSQLSLSKGDTLTYDTLIYQDSILVKGVYYNYIGDSTKSTMLYNVDRYPIREEVFELSTGQKLKKVDQFYSTEGIKLKSIEFDYTNGYIRFYKFETTTY